MNERRLDFEQLRDFTRRGDQTAFTAVVRRHLNLVYSVALRKLADESGAEEITQDVFTALARSAWRFAPDDSVPAWLYRTTLIKTKAWWRAEIRRRRREQTAAELSTTMRTSEDSWRALLPLLDEALLSLREKDRTALLLRYYEGQPFRQLGATLGLSEDAAQKRVAGAVERLAQFFQRRGFKSATIAVTAAALERTATPVPAVVVNVVLHQLSVIAPPALAGLAAFASRLASLTKLQKAAACAALLAIPVLWNWNESRLAKAKAASSNLQAQVAAAPQSSAPTQPRELWHRPVALYASSVSLAPAQTHARKEYSVHVKGLVQVSDFTAVLMEIQHHSFKGRPLVWNKVLLRGQSWDDRSVEGGYVRFALLEVNSATGTIRLGENDETDAYELEEPSAVGLLPRAPLPPLCLANAGFDQFVDVYGELLDRTLLVHPTIQNAVQKQLPVSFTGFAQDRAEASAIFDKTLQGLGIWTIAEGNSFALLVSSNLVQSVKAMVGSPPASKSTPSAETLPKGSIYFRNTSLAQVLPIYAELAGRNLVEGDPLNASPISFRNQTALSKAEAIYAFDTLLAWQNLKITLVGDKRFKVVRLPSAK